MDGLKEVHVVFHDQHGLSGAGTGRPLRSFGLARHGRVEVAREMDMEGGPLSDCAFHPNEALVLPDHPVNRSQAQPGALAQSLRGVERLEDLRLRHRTHAAAVIADGKGDIFSRLRLGTFGSFALTQVQVPGADGDRALPADGIPGVDQQVGEQLIQLGGIEPGLPVAGTRPPDDLDLLADDAPQHLERLLDGFVEVDGLR